MRSTLANASTASSLGGSLLGPPWVAIDTGAMTHPPFVGSLANARLADGDPLHVVIQDITRTHWAVKTGKGSRAVTNRDTASGPRRWGQHPD